MSNADWFIYINGKCFGPLTSDDIINQVKSGKLKPNSEIIKDGNLVKVKNSPFAGHLSKNARRKSTVKELFSAVGFLLVAIPVLILSVKATLSLLMDNNAVDVSSNSNVKNEMSPAEKRRTINRGFAEGVKEYKRRKAERVKAALKKTNKLDEAIDILQPYMKDTRGEINRGAATLAMWGQSSKDNFSWSQLEVMPDSRRVEIVKDPEPYRGRKLCSRGSVIEIKADRSVNPPLYIGRLITASGGVVRFVAVGSTDGIVQGTHARICGIFTGIQSYDNAAGGITNAVFEVGMFDIPENK